MKNIRQHLKSLMSLPLLIGMLVGFGGPVVLTTAPVFAVDIFHNCSAGDAAAHSCADCGSASNTDVCQEVANQDGTNPIIHIIKLVIEVISYIGGAAAIIGLIISGFRYTISNGDSNSIASARNGIIYSLVGIAVIVAAQSIVVFVLDKVN
jgi:hypothetical protein